MYRANLCCTLRVIASCSKLRNGKGFDCNPVLPRNRENLLVQKRIQQSSSSSPPYKVVHINKLASLFSQYAAQRQLPEDLHDSSSFAASHDYKGRGCCTERWLLMPAHRELCNKRIKIIVGFGQETGECFLARVA